MPGRTGPGARRKRRDRLTPAQAILFRKQRKCPLASRGLAEVDYLDVDLLTEFLDGSHRFMSSRSTGMSSRMQRRYAVAVKRARYLCMIPYTDQHSGTSSNEKL